MGGAEHFAFLWPKYAAGPYLALPGGGCLVELFPDFLLESAYWIFFSHRLRPTFFQSHRCRTLIWQCIWGVQHTGTSGVSLLTCSDP